MQRRYINPRPRGTHSYLLDDKCCHAPIGKPHLVVAARAEETPVALRAPCVSSAHALCRQLTVQL